MDAGDRANYALPLFALVDRGKVDLQSPQLPELAENLYRYLAISINLDALDSRIEMLGDEPYLVLNGVAPASLPPLLALADVQKSQLFRYHRESSEQASLTPLAVDPTAGDTV